MSLDTLLEAAKFLELQEQQHRATVEAALATIKPVITTVVAPTMGMTQTNLKTVTANTAPQTVVITSNTIPTSTTILQAPVAQLSASIQQVIKEVDQDTRVTSSSSSNGSSVSMGVGGTTVTSFSPPPHAPPPATPRQRILHNSFDIMNPLVIDEMNGGETKRRQPPMVFRSGTREVHNKLEKHRRAHLKECFDILKKQIPSQEEKKTSNLSILHSALRYIHTLKRRERELEHEMERLAREKISHQQRLAILKKEISSYCDNVDFSKLLPDVTSTVTPVLTASNDVTSDELSMEEEKLDSEPAAITVIPVHQRNGGGGNGAEQVSAPTAVPILTKTSSIPTVAAQPTAVTPIKEVSQQPQVQATTLSVLPMTTYPVNQGLVLQKVAIVPKALDGLAPLVQTHFITTPQQINGKVVPLTQYLRPVVVVSTASPRPS